MRKNKPVGGTHFHLNGFTRSLILTLRQQCCDMLRWHVVIVWPGFQAWPKALAKRSQHLNIT